MNNFSNDFHNAVNTAVRHDGKADLAIDPLFNNIQKLH